MTDETKPQEEKQDDRMMVITPQDLFDLDELRREVERRAADKICAEVTKGVLADVQKRISVAIEGQVEAVIMDAIVKRRQPTDWMGNPKGEVTTLEEEIIKKADKALTQDVDAETGKDVSYRRKSCSMLQFLCRKTMDQWVDVTLKRATERIGVKLADELPTEYIEAELKRLAENAAKANAEEEEDPELDDE